MLDNSPASQLQLDAAPFDNNTIFYLFIYFFLFLHRVSLQTHISRFLRTLARSYVCEEERETERERERERERQTDCGGPVSMATPARCTGSYAIQVIQTCDEEKKKKHAYKVSGIQMHCVYSYADSLSLSLWTPPHDLTHTHTHI